MNDLEEKKQRMSLTLLFSGMVFVFLVLTMIIVALVIYMLVRLGLFQLEDNTMSVGTFIVIITLTSVVIGTILSATVGRIPLRSVNTIINGMNKLAEGDFKTRLNFNGPFSKLPVTSELTDSFNKMASELESTEMLRSDFINNFSHEFKTPIVSIAGFAKLLRRGDLDEDEQKEYLGIIEDEALRLSTMATNVLEMSRVENQTILTDFTVYNLSEQIRNCVLLLENKWDPKHLELDLSFEEYEILANEELMKQVWVNLLDNAVKFTPDYGTVEIRIKDNGSFIKVTVGNTGSSIAPGAEEKIFQKFYQADESHASEGSGIGLAVAKRIIELHNGSISASSSDNKVVFSVMIPQTEKILETR